MTARLFVSIVLLALVRLAVAGDFVHLGDRTVSGQSAYPNADRAKLEEERAMLRRFVAEIRELRTADVPEELARMLIIAWKTERELQRVYGGRVIFQQAGPEALDARRRLFEQAEKDGDLTFGDAGVRHLFYYYANMRHTGIDEKALERPWFLDEEK